MAKRPPEVQEYIRWVAALGGKARMNSLTPEERVQLASKAGTVGGQSRARKLSAKRRKEIARMAAAARWSKTS